MLSQYTNSFVIAQTSSRSIAIDYKTLIIHLDADACFWGRWFKLFDSHQMIVNVNSTIYPCLIYLIWKIRSFKLIKTHSIHKTSIKNMDQEINLHWCSFLKILLIQSIRIVVKLKLSCNIDLIFGFSTSKNWKTLSFSNSYAHTHQKLISNQLYNSDKMMVHITKTHIVLCLMFFHSTKSKNDLIFGFSTSKQLENTLFQ